MYHSGASLYSLLLCYLFFFFKQKTAYEMRISDWSSDVCSSDLLVEKQHLGPHNEAARERDALALPTRHLVGHTPLEPAEFDQLERLGDAVADRSDERRVGKACVSTSRSLWAPYH